MRVVIDTNVFISSFFGSGPPRQIIDLWKTGQVTICLSQPIVDEYIRVLNRLGMKNEREIDELLNLFANGYYSLFTARTPDLKIVEEDPDDDKFFECAVALNADCIISGDKKVLAVKKYINIIVQNPSGFLIHFTSK